MRSRHLFSKLPIRQLTQLAQGIKEDGFSKLPIRQLTKALMGDYEAAIF